MSDLSEFMKPRSDAVAVDYVNWKGTRRERRVLPLRFFFGSTEFHPEPQWLFDCFDFECGENRTFALSGVKSWRPFADAGGKCVPPSPDDVQQDAGPPVLPEGQ